jgi:hypothetical protein
MSKSSKKRNNNSSNGDSTFQSESNTAQHYTKVIKDNKIKINFIGGFGLILYFNGVYICEIIS